MSADWSASARIIQTYRTAFASLQPGSVLFQFDQDKRYPGPLNNPDRWNPPLDKIVALATLDGVFVPQLYLKLGQQPALYRSDKLPLREFQAEERVRRVADNADLLSWLEELRGRFPDLHDRFSAVYVAVFDPDHRLAVPLPGARLISTLPRHRLYELSR